MCMSYASMSQTTYYWRGAAGSAAAPTSWTTATNWTTNNSGVADATGRATPAATDILIFDGTTIATQPATNATKTVYVGAMPTVDNAAQFKIINSAVVYITSVATQTAASGTLSFASSLYGGCVYPIVGTSTAFTTDFKQGDFIQTATGGGLTNGECQILSINSNTSMTVSYENLAISTYTSNGATTASPTVVVAGTYAGGVGSYVYGAGVSAGTTVLSSTGTTVNLSSNATIPNGTILTFVTAALNSGAAYYKVPTLYLSDATSALYIDATSTLSLGSIVSGTSGVNFAINLASGAKGTIDGSVTFWTRGHPSRLVAIDPDALHFSSTGKANLNMNGANFAGGYVFGNIVGVGTAITGASTPFTFNTSSPAIAFDAGSNLYFNGVASGKPTQPFGCAANATAPLSIVQSINLNLGSTFTQAYSAVYPPYFVSNSISFGNLIFSSGTLPTSSATFAFSLKAARVNNLTFSIANSTPYSNNSTSTMSVYGSVVNNSGPLNLGSVNFVGSSAQSISGSGTPSFTNLTVNNSNGFSLAHSSATTTTVNGVLTLTSGSLTTGSNNLSLGATASATLTAGTKLNISGGTTDFNSRSVTVQASAIGTAAIVNTGTLNNASNVTLQQWATGQRGYRILSNPFNSALTPSTIGTANGIIITGANDVKTYNGIANVWSGSVSSIAANTPYSVFIRGLASDLTAGSGSGLVYNAGPTAFAYSVTGTLNTSPVTITQNKTTVNDWTIAGNPFAAPVNSSALTGGTVGTPYYVYSMAQNNTGTQVKAGGWVAAGANSSITTPIPMMGVVAYQAGTGALATFNVASTDINTTNAAQTGLFGEADAITQLELQLNKGDNYQDKLFVRLNAGASDLGNERMDLPKLSNDVTNIYTIASDKAHLAVDARKGIDNSIPVGITAPAGSYTFTVASNNLPNADNVYLLDKLLNTKTVLVPAATYSFAITADAASKGNDRFELGAVKTAIPEIVANETFSVKVLGSVVNNAVTLQIKGAKAAVTITVTDLQGKIISNTTSSNVVNTLSLASGSGMYFIKVTDGENSVVNRVVKP